MSYGGSEMSSKGLCVKGLVPGLWCCSEVVEQLGGRAFWPRGCGWGEGGLRSLFRVMTLKKVVGPWFFSLYEVNRPPITCSCHDVLYTAMSLK